MPRDRNDPDQPRMIRARQREEQALDLRARGASLTAIGEQLGISHTTASRAIARALRRAAPAGETVEDRRMMLQHRIEQRRLEYARIASRAHPVLHAGKAVTVVERQRDGTVREVPLTDDGVTMQALAGMRDTDVDEAKLWGLDAAKRYEVSGEDGGPIEHEVRVAALSERIAALRSVPPVEVP